MSFESASQGENREALTRILSTESRNALARVELAASELSRFEVSPSQLERIDAIRSAVEEMDGLLGKIDLLANPRRPRSSGRVDLCEAAASVLGRLAPALEARGLVFEAASLGSLSQKAPLTISLTRASLDEILCGLVSVAGGIFLVESRVEVDVAAVGTTAGRFSLKGAKQEGSVSDSSAEHYETRLELELKLAEWRGSFFVTPDPTGPGRVEIGITLPLETNLE